jgi:hypothetical protein
VRKGREHGRKIPANYIEIHYEDLITKPHETLQKLGGFIDHELDYEKIRNAGLGRLSETNSSFRDETTSEEINPLGRWKERLSPAEIEAIESVVGACLEETGYSLSHPASKPAAGFRSAWMRATYPNFLSTKLWLKLNTPLGRLADMSALELEDGPVGAAQSAQS